MISLEVEIKSEPLKTIFEKSSSELNSIVSEEISSWAIRASNLSKSRSPVRTGNLRDSITGASTDAFANVSAFASYSKFVEPPPLGVPMRRRMTRTMFLYNSAMEELDKTVLMINQRIKKYFEFRS